MSFVGSCTLLTFSEVLPCICLFSITVSLEINVPSLLRNIWGQKICHNTENNMSYVSQHWQHIQCRMMVIYLSATMVVSKLGTEHSVASIVIRMTLFLALWCIGHCSQCCVTKDILSLVLWHVRHIVVSFVIHQTLLSVLWYVRHIVVSVVTRKTYCC
jgi:hypothetical protein